MYKEREESETIGFGQKMFIFYNKRWIPNISTGMNSESEIDEI